LDKISSAGTEAMFPDSEIYKQVSATLQRWGLEQGISKLQARIAEIPDMENRAAWHLTYVWLVVERGWHINLGLEDPELVAMPGHLRSWLAVIRAVAAQRIGDYQQAMIHLDAARAATSGGDCAEQEAELRVLLAMIALQRGITLYHRGQAVEAAVAELGQAWELLGQEHFLAGRVLDALGMVYTTQNDFYTARLFFEQAIERKQAFGQRADVALSRGQLGRLYLDWGYLEEAEKEFSEDLQIAQEFEDWRGVAQMYNCLGRVELAQGRVAVARDWLAESIRCCQGKWSILEGFAHKDLALTHVLLGELEPADQELQVAEALFSKINFDEGLTHLKRVRGQLLRAEQQFQASAGLLREALNHFKTHEEPSEAARTQLELARTLQAGGMAATLVGHELQAALKLAEACYHHHLVAEIEQELAQVDQGGYLRHTYRRARGREIATDTTALFSGSREVLTVMFLDVQNFTLFADAQDVETVLMTINRVFVVLEQALATEQVQIIEYRGDGFKAIARGAHHARRAVAAALQALVAMVEFNRPRRILGLPVLQARMGIHTGEVFMGNVGTYGKMDFTATGSAVIMAARMQSEAKIGMPCISQATYEAVGKGFEFDEDSPRWVELKGLGKKQVWDVAGKVRKILRI
jgi:class 3 adenylate cyclase/tetratricopeptide (TPR) repeat protein